MHTYEILQLRSAELIRRADRERLAREALRRRRAAAVEQAAAGVRPAAAEPHSSRSGRWRPARPA